MIRYVDVTDDPGWSAAEHDCDVDEAKCSVVLTLRSVVVLAVTHTNVLVSSSQVYFWVRCKRHFEFVR